MAANTDLTGDSISATYTQLLHIGDDSGIEATEHYVVDGNGTASALSLGTTAVGIGTDSPVVGLDIHHDAEVSASFGRADDASNYIQVRTAETQNNLAGIAFQTGSAALASLATGSFIGEVSGKVTNSVGALTSDMIFKVNSGGSVIQPLTILSSGDVTVSTGDLIMGTSGKGISFAATSDAGGMTSEVLDDYEEGTFTPVVSDGSNNATMHGSAIGYYTKIGDIVHINMYALSTSLGSVSGSIKVTGLPFTSLNGTGQFSAISVGHATGWTIAQGSSASAYISTNEAFIRMRLWDLTGGNSAMQESEWTADGECSLGGTYKTTT